MLYKNIETQRAYQRKRQKVLEHTNELMPRKLKRFKRLFEEQKRRVRLPFSAPSNRR